MHYETRPAGMRLVNLCLVWVFDFKKKRQRDGRRATTMRCLTMRALLFSLTTLIGIYEGILFFKFDTLSPCAALSVQVSRIHEQARSELGLPIGVAVLLRAGAFKLLQQRERQALGIPAPDTPLHCAFALGK